MPNYDDEVTVSRHPRELPPTESLRWPQPVALEPWVREAQPGRAAPTAASRPANAPRPAPPVAPAAAHRSRPASAGVPLHELLATGAVVMLALLASCFALQAGGVFDKPVPGATAQQH